MNKKIKNLFLAGAVILGLASVAVSCKDYDDDINKLEQEDQTLQSQIEALQNAVNSGLFITSVTSTDDGVTFVMSDGNTYTITNGEDGTPGSVVTIGDDGYWYIDGVKTDYLASGNGKWYSPGEDGYWYEHNGASDTTGTKTDLQWSNGGAVTAAVDGDVLYLYGVPGYEDGLAIELASKLKSIVFNSQVYVDGVPAIDMATYTYSRPDSLVSMDSEEEALSYPTTENDTTLNSAMEAEYYLNPANAKVDSTNELSYIYAQNDTAGIPFVKTRGQASSDFSVTPVFESVNKGVLKVGLTATGTPADSNYISIINLKVANGDTAVVSNDHTLYRHSYTNLVIANKKSNTAIDTYTNIADQDYRVNMNEDNGYLTNVVWNEDYTFDQNIDTTVRNTKPLDLNGIVALHDSTTEHPELSQSQFERLGLSWKFELVKNYKFGTPAVDQADYVNLSDEGILTVNTDKGQSASGRTPIVRVYLMAGDEIVKVAYIKVGVIYDEPYVVDPRMNGEDNTNTFVFACSDSDTLVTTLAQMKSQIYDLMDMDDTTFHNTYPTFVAPEGGKGVATSINGDSLIQWVVPMDTIWAYGGKTITQDVYYTNDDGLRVNVTLSAKVGSIAKTFNLSSTGDDPDYIDEYWWGPDRSDSTGFALTKFNVSVPNAGSTNADSCVFVSDLNAAFVTKDGKTVIDSLLSGLRFYFCKTDVEAINSIDGHSVIFSVVDNPDDTLSGANTILRAKVDTSSTADYDTIAVINNLGTDVPYNTITLRKDSDLAKALLNTDEFYTYIGASARYCNEEKYPVTITFDGEDHFRGDFIRPVYIQTASADSFIDGVDYGEDGSYIDLTDLISPYDWRDRSFEAYPNYWQYYGPFNITVDVSQISCVLNGVRQQVPSTIVIEQTAPSWNGLTSQYGFLTYKNNGSNVSSFDLYVPVTVEYGWGKIQTTEIKIPVVGTINQ